MMGEVLRREGRGILITLLLGIIAGLAATAFRIGVEQVNALTYETFATWPFVWFAVAAVAVMTLGGIISGILMAGFAPDAAGSGIPQVKLGYHTQCNDYTWNTIWVKFVGGVLAIGTGSSLGREGPTIHIAAAVASKLARVFKEGPESKANAVCAGSAAGLAAAFNSPLAGVSLVLEEIAGGKYERRFSGRALLAAATAVFVLYIFTNDVADLAMVNTYQLHWRVVWLSPVVALVAAYAGILFQQYTLSLRKRMKHSKIPTWLRPGVGAFLASLACVATFGLTEWLTDGPGQLGAFGLGEKNLLAALNGQVLWAAAAFIVVGKLVATILCYGSGGCGGIFAPIVVFGGMAGLFVGGALQHVCGLTQGDVSLLAITGMTAGLAGVVRAPITSILIVFEMTRQTYVLPALMIAAVVGVFMNRLFFRANFYDEALLQDGHRLRD